MNVTKIWFDQGNIFLRTKNGKEKFMPLEWFPRLREATSKQLEKYELSHFGIHWEDLDEDLSFEGFSNFNPRNHP